MGRTYPLITSLGAFVVACATAGTAPTPNDNPDADSKPDAARSDASSPDASQPDAPCTMAVEELLANGDFDMGRDGSWQEQSSYTLVDTLPITAHTGNYGVWLGGENDLTESLWQDVDVPAAATSIQVSGFQWIKSQEPGNTAYDSVQITLRTIDNIELDSVATWSNGDRGTLWQPFMFKPAKSYAGQTIRLRFDAFTNGTYVTSFFFDTMSLQATVCR